jgi:putative nucleotidyltransferase with HDIG domain
VLLDFGDIIKDTVILVTGDLKSGKKISRAEKLDLHHANYNNLISDLQKKYAPIKGAILLKFYNLNEKSIWTEIEIEKHNKYLYIPVDSQTSDFLSKAFKNGFTKIPGTKISASFINGYLRSDKEISSESINLIYIKIDKTVFFDKINSDKDLLIGYAVLLIIFSIVIGKIFAAKIIRPVNNLITAAKNISDGNYSYRNKIHCNDEIGFLGYTLNLMAERVDNHINEIEYRSKAMDAMNMIDKTVLKKLFDPDVIDMVAEIVAFFLGKGIVLLVVPDEENKELKVTTYNKFGTEDIQVLYSNIRMDSLNPENDFRKQEFQEIVKIDQTDSLPEWISVIVSIKHGTVIHAPLYSSGNYQGSCFIIDDTKSGYSLNELEAIRMLSDQVGVALQNSKMYMEKENLLLEILSALTRAIDAKSKWTSGHSGRVADLSVMIGKVLNLSEKEIDTLKISAMLHDIGKIATPENILDKPGKLTEAEYNEIKKHPEEGARIIGGIKSYEKIVPGILYHHEHWDGSGYPDGLKEDSIPVLSRIIAIADVYDAIISDRPYRKGMEKDQAYKFMTDNAGKLFDPGLLNIFINLNEKK